MDHLRRQLHERASALAARQAPERAAVDRLLDADSAFLEIGQELGRELSRELSRELGPSAEPELVGGIGQVQGRLRLVVAGRAGGEPAGRKHRRLLEVARACRLPCIHILGEPRRAQEPPVASAQLLEMARLGASGLRQSAVLPDALAGQRFAPVFDDLCPYPAGPLHRSAERPNPGAGSPLPDGLAGAIDRLRGRLLPSADARGGGDRRADDMGADVRGGGLRGPAEPFRRIRPSISPPPSGLAAAELIDLASGSSGSAPGRALAPGVATAAPSIQGTVSGLLGFSGALDPGAAAAVGDFIGRVGAEQLPLAVLAPSRLFEPGSPWLDDACIVRALGRLPRPPIIVMTDGGERGTEPQAGARACDPLFLWSWPSWSSLGEDGGGLDGVIDPADTALVLALSLAASAHPGR